VVGDVPETRCRPRDTSWPARWPPAICGSDLHALADFPRFHRAHGVGRRPPPLDPAADCVFGHEFCAEIVDHGPGHLGHAAGWGPVSAPCRSSWGPPVWSRSATRTSTPGALAEHLVLQELLCLPVTRTRWPPTLARADRAPRRRGARGSGSPGLTEGQPCLVMGVRAGRAGRDRRAEGAGPWPGARGRLLPDATPPRRGVRRRRGSSIRRRARPHDRWPDFGIARTVMERMGGGDAGGPP